MPEEDIGEQFEVASAFAVSYHADRCFPIITIRPAMDYERYSDWVKRSFRWIREEKDQGVPHHIQLLGMVDAELRGIRREHIYDKDGVPIADAYGIMMLERYQIQAHLWLLGAYELVRMISQRLRQFPELASDESILKVTEAKRIFERVRIPLAKLEPAARHKDTDFEFADTGMGERGLGWRVAEGVVIYQEELSDVLYDMFCHMRPRA